MFSIMFAVAFIFISSVFYYYGYVKQKDSLKQNLKSGAASVLNFADVLLESRNEKFFGGESTEIPQVIQNDVFDKFTTLSKGSVFFKEASLSPVNHKNLATPYEKEVIKTFKNNKELKELEKEVVDNKKEFFMLARPIIAEEKCKLCHPQWTSGDVIAIEDVRVDLEDFQNALEDNIFLTVITGVINIVIILILIHLLFSKYVSQRVKKLLQVIQRVEKGNFLINDLVKNEEVDYKTSNNEIDQLFTHVNQMVSSLRPVIENVVNESKHMAFNASYGFTRIGETNELVKNQHNLLLSSEQKLFGILEENGQMQKTLSEMLDSSENSQRVVKNSHVQLMQNNVQVSDAISSMENTTLTINDLKNFSAEIATMMEVISDIAAKTNLISLNAAIEAARAGVHGRSFAVVAEEVRKLAEDSQKNAENIRTVLTQLNQQIDNVAQSALESKESVSSLVESSQVIDKSFTKIKESFDLISKYLSEFNTQFQAESQMLGHMNTELEGIDSASKILVANAEDSQEIMKDTAQKGASLKTLADGFEVVLNNRSVNRTVLTPPLKAKDEHGKEIYIFDQTTEGISFYDIDTNYIREKNQTLKITLEQPLNGKKELQCLIVHKSQEVMNKVHFYGAKLL